MLYEKSTYRLRGKHLVLADFVAKYFFFRFKTVGCSFVGSVIIFCRGIILVLNV